jgi:hypothetical protein
VLLALVSCAPGPVGYGVVLLNQAPAADQAGTADAYAPQTGEVVLLRAESEIEDSYRVTTPENSSSTNARAAVAVPLSRWRVRRFQDEATALAFAAEYAPFTAQFAYANRLGLPVREEASATAPILYRLREAEAVKIVSRGLLEETVGEYNNYWYEVLTETGTSGYSFGEFLPVFEATGTGSLADDVGRLRASDPVLERLLAGNWRPEYFADMVAGASIDLRRLRPDYGLFFRPSVSTIDVRLEGVELRFQYENLERRGDALYILSGAGGGVADPRLTVHRSDRISMSHVRDGRLVTSVFVDLAVPVADLVAAERARRDVLYADLIRRAQTLRSNAYGTIKLEDGRRFRWSSLAALQPRLLPSGTAPQGELDYRFSLAQSLRSEYDGVLTFAFDGPQGRRPELTVLYAYEPAGIRVVVAGEPDAQRQVVDVSRSALVMYFAFE